MNVRWSQNAVVWGFFSLPNLPVLPSLLPPILSLTPKFSTHSLCSLSWLWFLIQLSLPSPSLSRGTSMFCFCCILWEQISNFKLFLAIGLFEKSSWNCGPSVDGPTLTIHDFSRLIFPKPTLGSQFKRLCYVCCSSYTSSFYLLAITELLFLCGTHHSHTSPSYRNPDLNSIVFLI